MNSAESGWEALDALTLDRRFTNVESVNDSSHLETKSRNDLFINAALH